MGNEMEMMLLMLLHTWNKRNEKGSSKLLFPWHVFIKKMNEWGVYGECEGGVGEK
jgi:hypothetical protein